MDLRTISFKMSNTFYDRTKEMCRRRNKNLKSYIIDLINEDMNRFAMLEKDGIVHTEIEEQNKFIQKQQKILDSIELIMENYKELK